jgi:hypothetical protein
MKGFPNTKGATGTPDDDSPSHNYRDERVKAVDDRRAIRARDLAQEGRFTEALDVVREINHEERKNALTRLFQMARQQQNEVWD